MEWIGFVALIIILCYSSYPSKVKKLENKVKKLKRIREGEVYMSKIIDGLVNKNCKIRTEEALVFAGSIEFCCKVLDVDDEWIKFTYTDKKNNIKTKILRIDAIESIELDNE